MEQIFRDSKNYGPFCCTWAKERISEIEIRVKNNTSFVMVKFKNINLFSLEYLKFGFQFITASFESGNLLLNV